MSPLNDAQLTTRQLLQVLPNLDAEALKTWHRRYLDAMQKPGHGAERAYTLDEVRRIALAHELNAWGLPAGTAVNVVMSCSIDGLGHQSWMEPEYRPRVLLEIRRNPDGSRTYKPALPFADEFIPDERAAVVLDLGKFLNALDEEIRKVAS